MKTALITGASSGIGRELALELTRRGWRVALLARRKDLLDETAMEIAQNGGEALALECDVTSPEEVERAVRSAESEWRIIDLAVANAGVSAPTSAARFELEEAKRIFRVNVEGTMNLMAAVLPAMVERRSGSFYGIASLAGFRGLPGSGAYSASKAAMQALLEAARVELAPRGVHVGIINPGFIRTPMTAKNRFRMPMLMEPDRAARLMADAIESRRRVYSFPWPMRALMAVMRHLPIPIYDRVTLPYVRAKGRSRPETPQDSRVP